MAAESLTLDGVELHSGDYAIREDSLRMDPPAKRYEWVAGADADGSALVRDPLFENREITFRLVVRGQTTKDGALAKVGVIVDKLEEAERQPDGIDLVWAPADGTKTVTFKVLSGEVTALPMARSGDGAGYVLNKPMFDVRLTCKPFGYGAEVTGATATSSNPVVTVTQASVTGDVPAEGRLVVTDMATQSRRHVEWGLQYRYYDAATALQINKADMTALGATSGTVAGSYNANVWSLTCSSAPTAMVSTGNQSHIGTFRVKARVYGLAGHRVRLNWQEGDGSFRPNPWVTLPKFNVWSEIDLGIVTVPEKVAGTQRWTGRIDAYSTTPGDTIHLDYLVLVPAGEGYGLARGTYSDIPGSLVARDEFNNATAGVNLDARAAPLGGSWVTSGSTTDLQTYDTADDMEVVQRSTTGDTGSGRFAILGSTSYTDVDVSVKARSVTFPANHSHVASAIARWVDSSNRIEARLSAGDTVQTFQLRKVVAGVATMLDYHAWSPVYENGWYKLRLLCFASGRLIAELRDNDDGLLLQLQAQASEAATGGSLQTGKPGFGDFNSGSAGGRREYDEFKVATPPSEPVVVYSGRKAEFRHDDQLRQDSTGTYYGAIPSYRGSRFLLPPAGDESRTSRVLIKARRNDNDVADDTTVTDSTKVELFWKPRYLVVAR
jgi:hypothetical protein